MSREEYPDAYAKGWQGDDIETLMGSLADSFIFKDPAAGEIPKNGMAVMYEVLCQLGKRGYSVGC